MDRTTVLPLQWQPTHGSSLDFNMQQMIRPTHRFDVFRPEESSCVSHVSCANHESQTAFLCILSIIGQCLKFWPYAFSRHERLQFRLFLNPGCYSSEKLLNRLLLGLKISVHFILPRKFHWNFQQLPGDHFITNQVKMWNFEIVWKYHFRQLNVAYADARSQRMT